MSMFCSNEWTQIIDFPPIIQNTVLFLCCLFFQTMEIVKCVFLKWIPRKFLQFNIFAFNAKDTWVLRLGVSAKQQNDAEFDLTDQCNHCKIWYFYMLILKVISRCCLGMKKKWLNLRNHFYSRLSWFAFMHVVSVISKCISKNSRFSSWPVKKWDLSSRELCFHKCLSPRRKPLLWDKHLWSRIFPELWT